jgi:hypothetical protein
MTRKRPDRRLTAPSHVKAVVVALPVSHGRHEAARSEQASIACVIEFTQPLIVESTVVPICRLHDRLPGPGRAACINSIGELSDIVNRPTGRPIDSCYKFARVFSPPRPAAKQPI